MIEELIDRIASTGRWPAGTSFVEMTDAEVTATKDDDGHPVITPSEDMAYLRVTMNLPGSGDLGELAVILPVVIDEMAKEGAPETFRSLILEAAQTSAAMHDLAWPADWPRAGVIAKCSTCGAVRLRRDKRSAADWLARVHRHQAA